MKPDSARLPAGAGMAGDPSTRLDLQLAEVLRVDPIACKVDIQFLTKTGGRSSVNVTFSGAGRRHMSGTMPMPGDIVIVGFMRFMRRGGYPVILGSIPNGWFSGLKGDPIKLLGGDRSGIPEGLAATIQGWDETVRHRFRQMYGGEHLSSSAGGGEIFLDRNAELMNRSLDLFQLRDADQTAMLRALNSFSSLASGRYKRGLVERSAMLFDNDQLVLDSTGIVPEEYDEGDYPGEYPIQDGSTVRVYQGRDELINSGLLDEDGRPYGLINRADVFPYQLLPDGRKQHLVTDDPSARADLVTPGEYSIFVEDRLEMPHKSDGVPEITREVDGFDADRSRTYIERVLGTVIGNDPYTKRERAKYGRVLRPVIFTNVTDGVGSARPRLEIVDPKYYDSLAAAYLFRMRPPIREARGEFGGDLMIAYDKDGAFYGNYPASSSANPLGAGWSAFVNMEGGIKGTIGSSATGNSIDLQCSGAVKIRPGTNKKDGTGLGLDVESSLTIQSRGRDFQGVSFYRRAYGDSVEKVDSNESKRVEGNRLDRVDGQVRQEFGRIATKLTNGGSMTSGKGYDETIIGLRRMVVTANENGGGLSREILGQAGQAADEETITVGGKSVDILAGDYEIDITVGNFSLETQAGKIDIKANLGIELDSLTTVIRSKTTFEMESKGTATFSATLPMILKSDSNISVQAPIVSIGQATVGGVVTGTPGPGGPHIDYLVGIPILGSPTVSSA